MPAASAPPPETGDAALAAAHQRIVEAGEIQLDLPGGDTPPAEPPGWLLDFLEWLGERPGILQVLFWAGVAVVVLLLAKLLWDYFSARAIRFRSDARELPGGGWWRPDAGAAKALLAEADMLAAAGRYEDAAHLLLLKSVEDIDRQRPGAVLPSLTARDIARLPALPADVGQAFGLIAGVVETSLFGGASVAREAWERARAAYAALAGTRAWA